MGQQTLASLGIVRTNILNHFSIKQPVYYADVRWEVVLQHLSKKVVYKEIPKYPEVRRDLALLLDEDVSFRAIYNIAHKTEKELLKKVFLFDVYQGDKLPKGKKSYAVGFLLQDSNKTLTDKQIDKTMESLLAAFQQEVGAQLRS